MKTRMIATALLLSAPSLAGAAPAAGRSPQVQKLGYYIGTWEGHGETNAGPFGASGKLSSRMTCSWFAGGFQVLCKGEEQGPSGKREFLNILSYDERAKAYTEYSVSSLGESEYDPGGTLVGNKLTFLVKQEVGGKPATFRYTETHLSPVLMTYRAELARGQGAWAMLAHGEIRKLR